jgi:hypothetical protein
MAEARRNDPPTSHEAAGHMESTGQEGRLEAEVVAYLKRGGRWTVPEIARAIDRHFWSISPRMAPLERKKLVVRAGRKPTVNSSGRVREMQAWQVK